MNYLKDWHLSTFLKTNLFSFFYQSNGHLSVTNFLDSNVRKNTLTLYTKQKLTQDAANNCQNSFFWTSYNRVQKYSHQRSVRTENKSISLEFRANNFYSFNFSVFSVLGKCCKYKNHFAGALMKNLDRLFICCHEVKNFHCSCRIYFAESEPHCYFQSRMYVVEWRFVSKLRVPKRKLLKVWQDQ